MAHPHDLNLLRAFWYEPLIRGCLDQYTLSAAARSALLLETYAQLLASGASVSWDEESVARRAVRITHTTARRCQLTPGAGTDPAPEISEAPRPMGDAFAAEVIAERIAQLPPVLRDLIVLLRREQLDITSCAQRLRLTLPQALAYLAQAVRQYADCLFSGTGTRQVPESAACEVPEGWSCLPPRLRRAEWIARKAARWISTAEACLAPAHDHTLDAWLAADLRHRAAYLRLAAAWRTTQSLVRTRRECVITAPALLRTRSCALAYLALCAMTAARVRAETPSEEMPYTLVCVSPGPCSGTSVDDIEQTPAGHALQMRPARSVQPITLFTGTTGGVPKRFTSVTIATVIARLNRRAAVRIEIADPRLLHTRVGGALYREDPFQFAAALQQLFGVSVVREGDVLRIAPGTGKTQELASR